MRPAPVTPEQLGLPTEERGMPVTLITDGKVEEANLRTLAKDATWLGGKLKELKLRSPEQVYLMTIDSMGGIYLLKKEETP